MKQRTHAPRFCYHPRAIAASLLPLAAIAHAGNEAHTATLPSVEVVGRTSTGAYHATEAAGAKTELPLRELPQAVRVMTRQSIDDLGATKLDDVLDYVGGVSRQNNFGGLWDNVAIRGLAGNENTGMATLMNGFPSNRGFNAPRDLAGIERIEFLKGPAAALYGASEPGGTLNIVSKRPLRTPATAVEAYLGSYGYRRLALDASRPVNDAIAWRLNVAKEDRRSSRDHISAEREVIAPALTWKLGRDTVLDYRAELLRHATPLDRGVVADAQGNLGLVPRDRFLGEPADGKVEVRNQTHQFILSHEWSEAWSSRFGLSYRSTNLDGFSTEPTALSTVDSRTLTRQRRWRDYASDDLSLQAELQGRLTLAGLRHELLLGAEAATFRMDTVMQRVNPTSGAPYSIDVLNPVYGQTQPTPLTNTNTFERQRTTALYVQDVVHLAPTWRLVAGLRAERFDQTLTNRRTTAITEQSPSATSPRVGLSWLPSERWTVYTSAGQSFRPNVSSGGRSFAPERGRALELGSKWESADRKLGATAALFHILKRNVLTADPNDATLQVATGEVRSQGLDFDLTGQLSPHWRVNAALVLADVEVTQDNTLPVGSRLINVAKVNGSALAVYEDTLANGQRWSLGGGVTHVGRRLGQTGTSFNLPAYTTAKLVAYWRLSPTLRLSLDVDNLFDATHYTSSYSRVWVTPGTARTVTAGLQARF